MTLPASLPSWAMPAALCALVPLLLWAEARFPLRRAVSRKLPRVLRNVATGAIAQVAFSLGALALVWPLAELTAARGLGLLGLVTLPPAAEVAVGVLLLDVTLWAWHLASHKVAFLWRFHVVHHADLVLDASTGLRFHFGEQALSVFYRAAQVVVLGVSPFTLGLWHLVLLACVLFHHSNVRLPLRLERALVRVIVTPRMHGIHHSWVKEETDSNFTSILTVWDVLFGTLRLDVSQQGVVIGVPAYREPRAVTLGRLQLMPFGRLPPTFVTPGGERPRREASGRSPRELAA